MRSLGILWILFVVITNTFYFVQGASFVLEIPSDNSIDTYNHATRFIRSTTPIKPKITSMHIKSEVAMRYVTTVITTTFQNKASTSSEVLFDVVLPEAAFITEFTMKIDEKEYKAQIKPKEEAKAIYDKQVDLAKTAGHISLKPRFSNIFVISVNLAANKNAVFQLKYEEILVKINNYYNLVININPGQIVDDMSVIVNIKETGNITSLVVPELRSGHKVENFIHQRSNENKNAKVTKNKNKAYIEFSPNADQQKQIMRAYNFQYANKRANEWLSGQLVVQYQVEMETNYFAVQDGYFVHFFAPNNLPVFNKYVVFVLDLSYSMKGLKLQQLKTAMKAILGDLKAGDRFSIVKFGTKAAMATNGMVSVNPKAILETKRTVDRLYATGGTCIECGIRSAFELIKTSHVTNKKDKVKPVIIFLSDGAVNVGMKEMQLSKFVKTLNTNRVPIFSLAFGNYAKRDFLRKFSLENYGFMRVIYYSADASKQLVQFYEEISSPLLSNVTYTYSQNQIDVNSVTKNSVENFYDKTELIVSGKMLNYTKIDNLIEISGYSDGGELDFESEPSVDNETWPMERLWSHLTIKELLDEMEWNNENKTLIAKKIVDIAMQFSFVTPLTSLVVVTPEKTKAIETRPLPPTLIVYDIDARFGGNDDGDQSGEESMVVEDPTKENSSGEESPPVTEIPTPNTLSKYGLDKFSWLEQFLSKTENSITISIKRKRQKLLLLTALENVTFDENLSCSNAVGDGEGKCVYLTNCAQLNDGLKSLQTYKNHYCINNQYAGICCKDPSK